MKRFFVSTLSVLMLSAAFAENHTEAKANPIQVAATSSPSARLVPSYTLVSLAYQGRFQNQGIPSAAALLHGQASGQITAETLVRAAIAEGRLSSQALTDLSYLNMVESSLADLNRG